MQGTTVAEPIHKLTHVGADGQARMVDVGDKPVTKRGAIAVATVSISRELADAIHDDTLTKGNAIETARLAGIQAAKHTATLIPLCHPLALDHADVEIALLELTIEIIAEARVTGRTGVEMEALTAASVAALTIIDMGKAIDKGIVIERVTLMEKWGGASGRFVAEGWTPRGEP